MKNKARTLKKHVRGEAISQILIATGGTGGHIFPALAFIEDLPPEKYGYLMLSDKRILNFKSQFPAGLHYRIITSSALYGWPLQRLKCVFKILAGTFQALRVIKEKNPIMTVSFGGYPAYPVMLASALLGVPIVIHESNALLGAANKFFLSKAIAVSLSFQDTKGVEKADPSKLYYTGSPIRKSVLSTRQVKYVKPKESGQFNIVVIGGSQGARIFSDIIPAALALLSAKSKRRIRIHHQCRPESVEHLKYVYESIGVNAQVKRFFDDIGRELKTAHLVISRAGALTIAELIAVGRPAILVPFAAASDNHQMANAKEMQDADSAWVMTEKEFLPQALSTVLADMMVNPERLSTYAAKARKMFRHGNSSFYKMFESCVQLIRNASK
jgi:UDP-N-acetylglucosamine--N-acetylmuramyl-(pentapeptide) pyrophosphoryl-undecaprenol N-acetylglucosamine transferase